jgi:hypothetical protein
MNQYDINKKLHNKVYADHTQAMKDGVKAGIKTAGDRNREAFKELSSPKLESVHFFTFMESIATDDNLNTLLPIVEGYCALYDIQNNVLTEASFNDFARKHGGKVKAFMAGLMLLASVASAGTGNVKANVDDGGHSYGGKAQTQMSSGGDGTSQGAADGQKLLQLLKNDKVDNNQLAKHFDSMKSHAKDPGYMDGLTKVTDQAGIDTHKIFDNSGHGDSGASHGDSHGDVKKLAADMKQTESNDEQVALSQGEDILRSSGVTGYDVGVKQLPNGNFVAVASPMTASK